ncbi:putative dna topoisomerase [Phaeomoniella chlamydospora]|uniref:DNA topoisomerase n=1 Tax=Phaeomoniella chlamydospora TaxID=158046 RepID=A0A0G2G8L4_PHACM|nr:putative dna topoisomerase [Phaeomoniella chlamydospora]
MTSVLGHLTEIDFDQNHRKWHSCPPGALFDANLITAVKQDVRAVADNIAQQARYAKILFIWTDCDREGENIGAEIRTEARKGNPRIEVKRAVFNNIERGHIIQAAQRPGNLDDLQANAVYARIELDLRIGAAFTRLQTMQLQTMVPDMASKVISYGKAVNFLWKRSHLFDRATVVILFEQCLVAKTAKVTKVQKKATSKWRPLPLTTVELQMQGSRFLRMTSAQIMKHAESLYNSGWISYPRTETDQFDDAIDLRALIRKQTQSQTWGDYATGLLDNGGFQTPRRGRHNDKAHPPIHPVNYVDPSALSDVGQRKIYEFIVRRFLACCSEDAKGEATDIEIRYGDEFFRTHGLLVTARNYLDIYVYDKWESSQQLPPFELGETFVPAEANITEGKTSAPSYLTEPELIALMDANGIGTDATMAEHIANIKTREYVSTRSSSGSRNAVQEFIPTTLGVALIQGYESILSNSTNTTSNTVPTTTTTSFNHLDLSKPFLRKELEVALKGICEGRKTKNEVVQESLEMWRQVFARTQARIDVLKQSVRIYVLGANNGPGGGEGGG